MLKKIDQFAKGWKRITTSSVFVAAVAFAAGKGIDLTLYVENVELVYAAAVGLYSAVMHFLQAIDQGGKS